VVQHGGYVSSGGSGSSSGGSGRKRNIERERERESKRDGWVRDGGANQNLVTIIINTVCDLRFLWRNF
jgi:hypothetical protein